MKTTLLLLIAFMLSFANITAQHQNIVIDDDAWSNEPSIYINKKNTNQILGGVNTDNYFYSNDGGYTWTFTTLSSTYGVWGDPCMIIDTAENYYFFHLSNPQIGNWIDRIICQKSTDFGVTWNNGSYMGLNGSKAQDKEWAIVDRTNNNIYVTWTEFDEYGNDDTLTYKSRILFSKSIDAGETWSSAIKINEVDGDCIDDDNTTEGAVPAVGPNGEIYVSWAGPEGIVFDKSLDQGETWLDDDIFVSTFPGGWAYDISGISRCNGLPVTICDLSGGAYHGTIYINWTDQRNGTDDTDVWLVKSIDGGDTWSESVRVNDDPPGKQQFFTWLDVDQVTGYLYFVFYDRRHYNDDQTDVFMAVSKDGGETFTNFIISEEPFIPNDVVFFGDYTNISAHNNVIRPIWTRLNNYDQSILTAIIDTNQMVSNTDIENTPFSIDQNYPNPFSESTYIKFKLKKGSMISLVVYDNLGNEVERIIDNKYYPYGKYVEHFDAKKHKLTSGVYSFSLEIDNFVTQQKMIFVE